jgi:hypothetical protein
MRQLDYVTAYSRGYADAQKWGRPYRDGFSPKHRLALAVPGCKYNNLAQAGYRDGWQDGKAAQLT